LLFHYGDEKDLLPYSFGPKNSLYFPVRCVSECLDTKSLRKTASALDLGCAVGRSSFELSRYCEKVVAIDNSQTFISAAKHIQEKGFLEYSITEEGACQSKRVAKLPKQVFPQRVTFECLDVMKISHAQQFDVVLAANLICRLTDPIAFLEMLSDWVLPNGQLILVSPYSWLEEFTPFENWLKNSHAEPSTTHILQKILKMFNLEKIFDLPFLMREHLRKYQWVISQATIWKKIVRP
jgi:putative 4-mercaptohistidine N1-methyltranferase